MNAEIGYARALEKVIIPVVDKRIENPILPFLRDNEYIHLDVENVDAALPILVRDLTRRKMGHYVFVAGVVGFLGCCWLRRTLCKSAADDELCVSAKLRGIIG